MKIFTLILIFSGLTGLNRCSSEIKFEFPLSQNKNESKNEKEINGKEIFKFSGKEKADTLISNIFIPNYNYYLFESKKEIINKSINYI